MFALIIIVLIAAIAAGLVPLKRSASKRRVTERLRNL